MADRIIAALAVVVAAVSFTWTATHDHDGERCAPPAVGHRHCCTDCASAVCVSCCAFYGGCCGG